VLLAVPSFVSTLSAPVPLLAQISFWDMVFQAKPVPLAVMAGLALLSILSWAIVFSKWSSFRAAAEANRAFARAFRKATAMQTVAAASEQFRKAPVVGVFDFGYDEVARQVKARGVITNRVAVERALQLGTSEAVSRLETNMNWLATVAAISPFVGLLGTVWGIIDAFGSLGLEGSASLRAVAPGISEALFTTALGLFAAIPAAIFYNYFSSQIREMGARMDDFCLEFLNLAERSFEE
jgi:biopolymer transport protein TolQ